MERTKFIELFERKLCWMCNKYKPRTIGKSARAFKESTCELNLRLHASVFHRAISGLNDIYFKSVLCKRYRKP